MRYGLTVTVAPTAEPVSLEDAKLFCRIDSPDFDAVIKREIAAARQKFEHITCRAIVTQTWRMTLDCFPEGQRSAVSDGEQILLPGGRVASVSSITYVDTDETTTTLASSSYRVDTDQIPARIEPVYGELWPVTLGVTGGVKITYIVGQAATAVPEDIKAAILHAVAYGYDKPGMVDEKFLLSLFGPFWVGGVI